VERLQPRFRPTAWSLAEARRAFIPVPMAKAHPSHYRARSSSAPLLLRVWRGDLPLWITYWLWGVAGNMSFVALLALLYFGGTDAAWRIAALWAVYAASLGWFVLIFGGIWRAAGRYCGPRVWAVLARIGVLVGVVRMSGEAVFLAALSGA